jgi:hypothetical protein
LGVAREMNFHALGQQAFASALATTGKDRPSAFGLHAGTESKLLFPRAFRWLIGAFHKRLESLSVKKEAQL